MNALRDVESDVVEDAGLIKLPDDFDLARRHMILTRHRGKALRPCAGSSSENFCCGAMSLEMISSSPIECSYDANFPSTPRAAVATVNVDLEAMLAEVSSFLAKNHGRFFRIRAGAVADLMALDPMIDFARVLIPFFASKRNAILEIVTRTSFIDHLLDLKHRMRTVISWPLNTESIVASEERGAATLDERLAAAGKAAAAGYGVGFHIDPIIINSTVEGAISEYGALIDKALASVPARSIAWMSLGLFKFPSEMITAVQRRFPATRIFAGELVPVGKVMKYPRFVRERVLKSLWEKACAALPAHKIYLCAEGPAIWNSIDPSVQGRECVEKRLCNLEALPLSF